MEINERFIQVSGRIPVSKELSLGEDIKVVIAGQKMDLTCVKSELRDNQDGTADEVYVLKYFA